MKKFKVFLLLGVIAFLSEPRTASGQATASSSLQGTVLDKSQSAVADASVALKSKQTGLSRTATTGEAGTYHFELLPVGVYVVTITKPGFSAVEQTVETMVGQTATANAELSPGAMSETIEVTSDAPIIDRAKTDVSQSITPTEVEELPMLGRDVANLAYLAPGVKPADSYDPTKNRYAVLSVNGQSGRNVNVTINGVDNKDNTVGGPVMQMPLEAVQEFVISTQRFSAANGRSEGAAINLITKSGTNNVHGSVFGFFRDEKFNAIDKFASESGH